MEKRDALVQVPSLEERDMVTSRTRRRAFLAAVGFTSTALVGSLLAGGCLGVDKCDSDRQTDVDVRDPANRKKDRCDSDGSY